MGRSCGRGPEGSGPHDGGRDTSSSVCAHRARLRGAGSALGVSRGVPWGLPESPSLEEQGLWPIGTSQESRDTEVQGLKTPRHRLQHNVAVLTSKFLLGPQFVHLKTSSRHRACHLAAARQGPTRPGPPTGCHSGFKHYAISITNYRQNLPAHCQRRWGSWGQLTRSQGETGLASPATSPPPRP